MLEANDMVEAKMAEIRERKMYEMKRMYAARMDEIFGALTKADIEKRRKAGYKKASDVLGDPREKERKSPRLNPKAKILKHKVSEETLDEMRAPGEIPGSEERKQDAERLRKIRNDLGSYKSLFNKPYLKKRKKEIKAAQPKEPKEKSRYADTPGGRNREKFDKIAANNPPGGAVVGATKLVGTGITKAAKSLGHELGSIGFSNLE